MSRKCCITSCKSFDGECSFFSIPKASFSSWTEIIKTINGCDTKIKFICEKHFLPKDIIKTYAGVEGLDFNQKVKPSLAKGAIPQIFDTVEHGILNAEQSIKRFIEESPQKIVKCRRQLSWPVQNHPALNNINITGHEVLNKTIDCSFLENIKN